MIGVFYVLCSYAWVFGAGFNDFVSAGDRRRSVAQPRQGVLGQGLDPRLPRDLQLDRGELERRGERSDARVLRARAQRARARAARRTRRSSRRRTSRSSGMTVFAIVLSLLVRLEVGRADRLLVHRDARRAARDPRLHADLRRLHLPVPDEDAGEVQPDLAPRRADRRDRPVLLPALLPVLRYAAHEADPVRELGRDRVDGGRHRADALHRLLQAEEARRRRPGLRRGHDPGLPPGAPAFEPRRREGHGSIDDSQISGTR